MTNLRRLENQCPNCIAKDRPICGRNQMKYIICPDFADKRKTKTLEEIGTVELPSPNAKLSPNHYSKYNPQPIEVIKKWFGLKGCLAHVFTYLPRAGFKDGENERDDIKKAINWLWYYLFDCFPSFPDEQDSVDQSKNK